MQTPEFVEKTQLQIARGQLDAALEGLTEFVKDNKTLYKAALNQAGHYAELERKVDAGTILPQEADVQRAQIRTSVLNLLDRLEQTEDKAATKKNKMPQMALIGLGVIVLVIAGVFIGQRLNKDNNQNNKTNNVVAKIDSSANGTEGKDTLSSMTSRGTKNKKETDNEEKETKNITTSNKKTSSEDIPPPPINNDAPKKAFAFDVNTNKGKNNITLTEDEELKISLYVNKPSYVRLIYILKDGQAVLLHDQYVASTGWTNLSPKEPLYCASPFGKEKLHIFMQSVPFTKLNTTNESGYDVIKSDIPTTISTLVKRGGEVTKRGLKKGKAKQSKDAFFKHKIINVTTEAK